METRNIIVSAKVTAEEKDKIEVAASIAYKRGEIPRSTPSTFIRTVSVAAAENVLTGGTVEKDREKGKQIRELQEQLQEYKVKKEEAEKAAGEWQANYNKEKRYNDNLTSLYMDLLSQNSVLKQQIQQLMSKLKSYETPWQPVIDVIGLKTTIKYLLQR